MPTIKPDIVSLTELWQKITLYLSINFYFTFSFQNQAIHLTLLRTFSFPWQNVNWSNHTKISLYFNCHVYDVLANQWKYHINLFLGDLLLKLYEESFVTNSFVLANLERANLWYVDSLPCVAPAMLLSCHCLAEICILDHWLCQNGINRTAQHCL